MIALQTVTTRYKAPVSALLFLVLGSGVAYYFGASGYYSRIVASAGLAVIVVLGLNVLTGLAGQLSLGHAGFYAVGAYTTAILSVKAGLPVYVAMLLGILIAGILGVVLAAPALRVSGPYLAMVTLAFGIIVYSIAVNFPGLTGGAAGLFPIPKLSMFGHALTVEQMNYIIIALGAIGMYSVGSLIASRWGRALRAISGNPVAAASSGISVVGGKRLAFVLSALLAGLAGGFYAVLDNFVNPTPFHFELSILFLTMLVVGGIGTLWGPVLGVVIMVVVERSLADMTEIRLGVYAVAMFVFVRFMPRGVVGVLSQLVRRLMPAARGVDSPVDPADETAVASVEDPGVRQMAPAREPILTVSSVTRRFGELTAVDSVSLTVVEGAIHAIVGPNGAGKTSLFNLVSGVDQPDGGEIRIDATPISDLPAHRVAELGVARTFQNLALFDELTVIENVLIGAHLQSSQNFIDSLLGTMKTRREEAALESDAWEILRLVGLGAHARELAGGLPQGLRRHVELARALAAKPRLLLLDEPAAGLNSKEAERLGELIRRIGATGVTVVFVEHHMKLVMSISDHVTVMDSGRVIAEGFPEEIQNDERVITAYLGAGSGESHAERH